MPQLNLKERNDFLAEDGVLLRIAVVRQDGSPLITPIWFIHEEGAIFFTPRERSEWFTCLRADTRVSLSIDEDRLPYRKVLVDGHAELIHDVGHDDKWRDQYRRIASRYVPAEQAEAYVNNTINEPRGLYRVVLSKAKTRSWRMPLPDEAQEGIWHNRYYQDPKIRFGK